MKRKALEKSGLLAIQSLRKSKHAQGYPFMINSSTLPEGQCYLEFPNGIIQLVRLDRIKHDFKVIRELSPDEQIELKKKHQLL